MNNVTSIQNFPGYTIERDGTVWGLRGWQIKDVEDNGGYRKVGLYRDGKQHNQTVHRLVATAYLPNPKGFPCVCHKNNNKSDNHADNLYWATHRTNSQHAHRDNLVTLAHGDVNGMAKLNNEKVTLARLLVEEFGWTQSKVYKVFGAAWGIGSGQVHNIVRRKSWTHI